MLITEGAHLSHAEIFGQQVGAIPKGYLYFAIAFSLGVEALNMRVRKGKNLIHVSNPLLDDEKLKEQNLKD
jgi:predicted tellurium resistance membrane protein TerC